LTLAAATKGEWMDSGFMRGFARLSLGVALFGLSSSLIAQEAHPAASATDASTAAIPDAPQPQIELADAQSGQIPAQQQPAANPAPNANASGQSQSAQQAAASSDPPADANGSGVKPVATQPCPDSQSSSQQPCSEKTQKEKAEEQLKEQEHQRVAGIMATFNTTQNRDAVPLSAGQKFRLFFRSATDPWPFGLSAVVAGINQAADAEPEWGQGMQGYAKRFGAGYSDYFIGNFFGNAVLPAVLHEDPRYFQKGSGSFTSRFLWAAASTVWCKRDRGTWGPNWANVGGNLIGAAIGRAYYPASERTVSDTISDGLTVSAEGIVGAEVIEFWPDMLRHYRRKKAEKQARAMDAAAKQQKQQEGSQKQ
jgi:hypothetical protein